MLRVALFSELPTPYRWPVFSAISKREDLDVDIFFCSRTEADREWEFDFHPCDKTRFLPVRTASITGRRTIHYHVNHTVFGELGRGRYDVVVFPGYAMFASHAGELWCRVHRTPYVVFSETTELDERKLFARALKRAVLPVLVGGASAWLATGSLSSRYLQSYGAVEERVFRFPNTPDPVALGREADSSRETREAVRARYGGGTDPVVLFVGRLLPVKRCDLLLDAVVTLKARGVEPEVWIAGDGADRWELVERARVAGLTKIRFLGNLPFSELVPLYAAADLFVLPSDHEPWGAVVCEAAACGLPLVLSDRVGAAPDVLDTGENGALFPHGDRVALADALERLLSEPAGLRKMGDRSRVKMMQHTHERSVDNFVAAVRAAHSMRRSH